MFEVFAFTHSKRRQVAGGFKTMTFQPIIPSGGLTGWRYLNQTIDRQLDAFTASPLNQRDTDYFSKQISSIQSAEELVADRRLLRVALGAFGLQDDINSKAFIQKVLEGGTDDPRSLANRLADDRYTEFARAFGFGNITGAETSKSDFAQKIVERFSASQFEVAVGDQDESMRLALNAKRELADIASRNSTEDTKWFLVLGTPPLRAVFEKALALPTSFGQIDIEKQLETIKDLSSRRLGIESINDFKNEETTERFVERFLLQAQIADFSASFSSTSVALTLLQGAG
ncbi:DUF1217 domain-containing protein [Primorskyibacter sp. S187A]|uniref:DUF1217 domain-containing protein n=1 Tax=Primorskyibacter sp. S187A TaxID=3415130 RepID=UPI003C7AAE3D